MKSLKDDEAQEIGLNSEYLSFISVWSHRALGWLLHPKLGLFLFQSDRNHQNMLSTKDHKQNQILTVS